MPRLLGHVESPADKFGLGPLHGIDLTAGPLPDEWHEPLPDALDQLFQDCVANATAVAICHAQWAADGRKPGKWPEIPSRSFLYAVTRLAGGQSLLEDNGSMIHSAFEAVGQLGFPRESAWDYGPHRLHQAPDWEVLRDSLDQLVVAGAHRIVSTGGRRVLDVATAIAAGSVVVLGSKLDDAFFDLKWSDVWVGCTGTIRGGHAMLAHAFRRTAVNRLQFALRSSWGTGFADNGSAWVDEGAIASTNTSDLWICELAPQYSE